MSTGNKDLEVNYKKINMNGRDILIGSIGDISNTNNHIEDWRMRQLFLEDLIELERCIQVIGYELMYYDAVGQHIPDGATIQVGQWFDAIGAKDEDVLENKVFEESLKIFFKKFVRDFSRNPLEDIIRYINKFDNKKWFQDKIDKWNEKNESNIGKKDLDFYKKFRNKLVHAKHMDLGEDTSFWDFTEYSLADIAGIIKPLISFMRFTAYSRPLVRGRVITVRTGQMRNK